MLVSTKAIVLHAVPFSDNSLIINFYTEEFGKLTCILKAVRSKNFKNKLVSIQALFILNLVIYYRKNREIHIIKDFEPSINIQSIPFEITKSSIAIFLAEVVHRTIKEHEKNLELFNFLFHSIEYLDLMPIQPSSFHLLFLLRFAKFLGIYPMNNYSESMPFFNLEMGQFNHIFIHESNTMNREMSQKLHELMKIMEFESTKLIFNSNTDKNVMIRSLVDYFKMHLDGIGNIKSLDVLSQVFSS